MEGQPTQDVVERIKSRTDTDADTGCWIWQGSTSGSGYGDLRIDGDHHYAHRIMYRFHNGDLPEDKPFVCHTCDTPTCVNPDHLFAGSHQDNIQDAADKGRVPTEQAGVSGEEHHDTELTESDVVEIRERYATGNYTQSELADMYDMTQTPVGQIVRGETWQSAGGPTTNAGKGRRTDRHREL